MYRKLLLALVIVVHPIAALAHPAPEVPVRTHIDTESGTMEIRVEVDPRVYFEGDPEDEPYLMKWVLDRSSEEEIAEMIAGASPYIEKSVKFLLEPEGELTPAFEWKFGKLGDDGTPLEKIDDKSVMIGSWTTPIPEGATGFFIVPAEEQNFSTIYENFVDGEKLERFQVLFGGETSYVLSLPQSQSPVQTPQAAVPESAEPVEPATLEISFLPAAIGIAFIAGLIGLVAVMLRPNR